MESNAKTLEQLAELRNIARILVNNSKDLSSLIEMKNLIQNIPKPFINMAQPLVLSAFYPILKSIADDTYCYTSKEKYLLVEILKELFGKTKINNISLFFNIYSFLLFEVYDHKHHKVMPTNEEYKLLLMECVISLSNSVTSELVFEVYTKVNAPKLCQMVYVALEIAKTEKMRVLRIEAIKCIMSLARVLNDNDFQDIVARKHVSETFLFFLPGLSSGLKNIALEDEKVGHKIPEVAITAWGRLMTLLLQDYNPCDNKFNILSLKNYMRTKNDNPKVANQKLSDVNDIKEYLQTTKQNAEWYAEVDKKLQPLAAQFMKFTYYSHYEVRTALSWMCYNIVENCLTTIPRTSAALIEIVIVLTQSDDNDIATRNKQILNNLSKKLSSDEFQLLVEILEEGFLNGINQLPRKFNSVDDFSIDNKMKRSRDCQTWI